LLAVGVCCCGCVVVGLGERKGEKRREMEIGEEDKEQRRGK